MTAAVDSVPLEFTEDNVREDFSSVEASYVDVAFEESGLGDATRSLRDGKDMFFEGILRSGGQISIRHSLSLGALSSAGAT